MIFNSMAFAIFLPITFVLYWICPAKYRYIFLLAASFYFYMYLDEAGGKKKQTGNNSQNAVPHHISPCKHQLNNPMSGRYRMKSPPAACHDYVCPPDLLRFFRIYGYRHWLRCPFRHPAFGKVAARERAFLNFPPAFSLLSLEEELGSRVGLFLTFALKVTSTTWLLRFFRIYGYRHWLRCPFRHPAFGKFQKPIFFP